MSRLFPRAPSAAMPSSRQRAFPIEMVLIPAGEFWMGSAEPAEALVRCFAEYHYPAAYFADEYPQHRVRSTRPFLLGKYEVTVGQWRTFAKETAYRTEAERDGTGGWGYNPLSQRCEGRRLRFNWINTGFEQTERHPVVNVSFNDAIAFCQWLSICEGRRYRLPTEAEWEYACRAGTQTRYAMGDNPADLLNRSRTLDPAAADVSQHVHELEIVADGLIAFTCPVGCFPANDFGLHDMHGNVWEWTADWYAEDYYARSPANDPPGPPDGEERVRRGGGWNSFPLWARSSFRNYNSEESRCLNLGFRVAADV
jgi:formylglycine-generating enzyme required for sulfatase activity